MPILECQPIRLRQTAIPIKFLIGLFLLFSLSACSSKKKVADMATVPKEKVSQSALSKVEQQLTANEWQPQSFSAKAKVKYSGTRKVPDFVADVRIQKDRKIWVSISPPLLKFEVARALITPDSVKVVDRFNKQYVTEKISYLQKYISYPLDFYTLQNIILGNRFYEVDGEKKLTTTSEDTYLINTKGQQINSAVYLNKTNFYINAIQLDNSTKKESLDMLLSDYQQINHASVKQFSHKRKITIQAPDRHMTDIKLSKVKIDQPLRFPFSINTRKYKRRR